MTLALASAAPASTVADNGRERERIGGSHCKKPEAQPEANERMTKFFSGTRSLLLYHYPESYKLPLAFRSHASSSYHRPAGDLSILSPVCTLSSFTPASVSSTVTATCYMLHGTPATLILSGRSSAKLNRIVLHTTSSAPYFALGFLSIRKRQLTADQLQYFDLSGE